jgi:hypothetical protein
VGLSDVHHAGRGRHRSGPPGLVEKDEGIEILGLVVQPRLGRAVLGLVEVSGFQIWKVSPVAMK